jgi:diacylglycerol kinase family enzyme
MQVDVLINQNAGKLSPDTQIQRVDAVRDALKKVGVTANIHAVAGGEMRKVAAEAVSRGIDAVVAAGGDGTVNAVASALAGSQTPLGVLPLGTLNHFAKDNRIPVDLSEAAQVIATNNVEQLDVGRVNDHIFVNNSSLGVYAKALIGRDVRRDKSGMSKWPAMVLASWKVFRRSPLLRVRLTADGEADVRRTPLVFVGNNEYQLDLLRVGSRVRLDQGCLSLYIANTTSRWGMLKLGVRAALGRLRQSRDF